MNIPLHMLLLAGLVAPSALSAQATSAAPVAAETPADIQPYSGLNLGYLSEKARAATQPVLPAGIGVLVGFVDPTGPAANKIEEGDILTRLDDQILMNSSQFQSLVRLRQPGDTVKVTLVRGAEVQVVELKLDGRVPKAFAARPSPVRSLVKPAPANSANPGLGGGGRASITINGQPIEIDLNHGGTVQAGPGNVVVIGPNNAQLPPEVLKRLEEMRARGLPIPSLDPSGAVAGGGTVVVEPGVSSSTFSKSFSFSLGTGSGHASSSVASDQDGTVSLEEKDGKRHVTIKDPAGKVQFDGDVTTPEQRAAMSEEARRRLKLVEGNGFSIPGFPNGPGVNPKADGAAKGGVAPAEEKPKKKRDPKEGA
jgi:hypothetical protein